VAEEAANDIFQPFVSDIGNEGFERIECFNYSSQAGQLLRDIIFTKNDSTRITAIWNSIWLRTSTKQQDIVYGSMHLFGVNITVDYTRSLSSLIFELASRTLHFPGWLTIGSFEYHHPSGLLPLPPPFEPNDTPEYGVLSPARKYIRSHTYLSFDVRLLRLSIDHGHAFCARLFYLKSHGEIKSLSLRKNATRFIFGAKHGSFKHKSQIALVGDTGELQTECQFDGDLGSYVVVIGHRYEADSHVNYEANDNAKTSVFFFRQSSDGKWERKGTGEIGLGCNVLGQTTPKRHYQLLSGALSVLGPCNC